MTYAEALAYIASLEPRGWRLGLDRMTEFIRRAGLESAVDGTERKYIHVAGTNGKGSVTAFLQSLLVEARVRAGAFFSPYVINPRERVQLGRELISESELAELTAELRPIAEAMDGTEFSGITEFEFKTALGFLAWRRARTEWVALETGLGGRLDATNVVTPVATVIVSIGLDHQAILGGSIEKIAQEKAGIIKPGVPLILGDVPTAAARVILDVAAERNASVWRFGEEIRWDNGVETPEGHFSGLQPALYGVWQPHNLSLAVAAVVAGGLRLSQDAAQAGAAAAFAPGRYQRVVRKGRIFILDGAHNTDSALALEVALRSDFGDDVRLQFMSNMLFGHEPAEFYSQLQPVIRDVLVPPIDFHRARAPEAMARSLEEIGITARAFDSIDAALRAGDGDPIVVTGSFYLVGEVARKLGL